MTMDTENDGVFGHDETDITRISYVLGAANRRKDVVSVHSDVFVLLVYWVYRVEMQCRMQMEW